MSLYYIAVVTYEEELILRVGTDIWMFHNSDNARTVAERIYWDRRAYGRPVSVVNIIEDYKKIVYDSYDKNGWVSENFNITI